VISRAAPFFLLSALIGFLPLAAQADPTKERMNMKALPKVTEWRDDTVGKVRERSRKALSEGADALEKLANVLLKEEMRDAEGRYVTPFFYREICVEKDEIRGEAWAVYLDRTFREWRERYPESGPAKIASARFHFLESEQARNSCVGVDDVNRKWDVVEEKHRKGMELLRACRDWNKRDPGWSVTFLVIAEKMGVEESEAHRVLDEAMAAFPDSSYILSRGGFLKLHSNYGLNRGGWEPWVRDRLKKLPPDQAAKLYVGTWAEMAQVRKFDVLKIEVKPDVELLNKGLDMLAAESPDSPSIACQEAYLSMHLLVDRKRAFNALKRAGGIIDLHLLGGKAGYEYLLYHVAATPWKIETVGIRPIENHRGRIPVEFLTRLESAADGGPQEMEDLIRKVRSEEIYDRDGKYQSGFFFDWFDQTPENSREFRIFLKKKKLVEDWMKQIPDSPFARLAAAKLWVDWAWDARGASFAHGVKDIQWKAFRERLKTAEKYLMACRELQETEPAWSAVAFTLMLGQGGEKQEFEGLAEVLFERFPDADLAVAAATMHFRPQWGGRPGTWEPWLKRHLSVLPEDKAARAYARVMNDNAGFLAAYEQTARTLLGDGKVDVELWLKGLEILKAEFPDSTWVAAGEAIVHSHFTENSDKALAAFKKINGTIDYGVWGDLNYFDRCSRWCTRTQTQKKK
jgi:hypothetical protein